MSSDEKKQVPTGGSAGSAATAAATKESATTTVTIQSVLQRPDGKGQRVLFEWLQQACEQADFVARHRLDTQPRCCLKKSRCKLLSAADLLALLLWQPQPGLCTSCQVPLLLTTDTRELRSFALPNYNPALQPFGVAGGSKCKTFGGFDMLKQPAIEPALRPKGNVVYAYCQGCAALLESCYYNQTLFNKYRKILFHQAGNVVPARRVPRLDWIGGDAKRSLKIGGLKKAGGRALVNRRYLEQQGMAVFPVPESLQVQVQNENADRRAKRRAAAAAGGGDTKQKAESKVGGGDTKQKAESKVGGANDDYSWLSAADLVGDRKGKKKVVVDKKDKKDKKQPAQVDKSFVNRPGFVVFAVPIDPRHTSMQRSLSSITMIRHANGRVLLSSAATRPGKAERERKGGDGVDGDDEDQEMVVEEDEDEQELTEDDPSANYLFTTKLLKRLVQRFDYEDFLSWALQTFRRWPETALTFDASAGSSSAGDSKERKVQDMKPELTALADVLKRRKVLTQQGAQLRNSSKQLMGEQKQLMTSLAPTLLRVYEANDTAAEAQINAQLEQLHLVPRLRRVSAASAAVKSVSVSFLANVLPKLLYKHGLLALRGDHGPGDGKKQSDDDSKQHDHDDEEDLHRQLLAVRQRCTRLIQDLCQSQGTTTSAQSPLTLTHCTPEDKEEAKRKRKAASELRKQKREADSAVPSAPASKKRKLKEDDEDDEGGSDYIDADDEEDPS